MFEFTINEAHKLTIDLGNFICIENLQENTAKYYDWDNYLKIDNLGDASSKEVLKTLTHVYETFDNKL